MNQTLQPTLILNYYHNTFEEDRYYELLHQPHCQPLNRSQAWRAYIDKKPRSMLEQGFLNKILQVQIKLQQVSKQENITLPST
jgi:hypothetical protein